MYFIFFFKCQNFNILKAVWKVPTPVWRMLLSLQLCPTLCDPRDGSPLGSPVPGILQARTLEWVAISFSNAWKVKSQSEVTRSCPTLRDPHGVQPTRLLHPWDFPGKSTGAGCHCLLQNEYNSFNYHSFVIYRSSKDHVVCLILKQLRQDFCSPVFKDRSYI